MHKRPKNGISLPTGGQLETVIYVFPPSHKENKERERKKSECLDANLYFLKVHLSITYVLFLSVCMSHMFVYFSICLQCELLMDYRYQL